MNQPQIFNGKNIVPGLPDMLVQAVTFLSEKEKVGAFEYGSTVSDWGEVDELIEEPLCLGYHSHLVAHAVGLAYIVSKTGGHIEFPDNFNEWSWASALSMVAPVSGWDAPCLAQIVRSFHIVEDKGLANTVANAVRVYCRAYFDSGLALLNELPSYKNSIHAGMMEGDFDRFCTLYPPIENQELVTCAFIHTAQMPQATISRLYDASTLFSPFDSKEAMTFLLAALDGMDDGRKEDCKHRILSLLQKVTDTYVDPVCNWAVRQTRLNDFLEECILALIKGLDKKDKHSYLKTIDNALAFKDNNSEFLEKVLMCVAENLAPMDILTFEFCLNALNKDREGFQNFVLFFILHPKGLYRIVGRRLWDNYHLESSSFEPTHLTEELQCMFIVFMLQDYGNPETRLPKIVPLFKSKSKLVLNILATYIRPYTDEYMGYVTKVIDDVGVDTKMTRTLKKYIENRHISIEKRVALKELSPKYGQYEVYREALRTQNEHLKQEMAKIEKETEKESFLGMLKSQVLARSGGIRRDDGTTQHLMRFEAKAPARIMAQSMMPLDIVKWEDELLKDYDLTTGNR